MNFRPRLDQPLLGSRETAAETFNRVECEDRRLFLVVSMEMRPVMRTTGLDEHPNHDAKKPGEFGHRCKVLRFVGCKRWLGVFTGAAHISSGIAFSTLQPLEVTNTATTGNRFKNRNIADDLKVHA